MMKSTTIKKSTSRWSSISSDRFEPNDSEKGRIHLEARVMIPDPQGFHASWWMMPEQKLGDTVGNDAVDGAEIDVYEAVPNKDNRDSKNTIHSGLHWDGYGEHHQANHSRLNTGTSNIYGTWQTVGLTWEQDKMEVRWNGKLIDTHHNGVQPNGAVVNEVLNVPHNLIFSQGFRGENFSGFLPEDLDNIDQISKHKVAWVRAFKEV